LPTSCPTTLAEADRPVRDAGSPRLVEVVRGGFVEGWHHGSAVGLAADGGQAYVRGEPDGPMLPRSCAKPLQAVGMLRAGLRADDRQLALVCASHSGEPEHLTVVESLLDSVGLDVSALDNTPGMPLSTSQRRRLTREGRGPTSLTANCSGKHAGMLATCAAAGWPTDGYRDPGHPLQRARRDTVADLTGDDVVATVVDGCGAPLFAVTLAGLARAFARVAGADPGTPEGRVAAAMSAYPSLVGGAGRDVTALLAGLPGCVAKDGAEGVYALALPDGRAAAVTIDDGGERARLPALVAALQAVGVRAPVLDELASSPVMGHGEPVGEVRAVTAR
jgi:L-asparaginase II